MLLVDILLNESIIIPPILSTLAKVVRGKNYESAKRIIVSKTGSVRARQRFDDDVADAIFLRLQRTSQIGQFTSEQELMASGRNAHRLEGNGTMTVYRSCPPGTGIRPGDFCTDSSHEAGYYKHGGNRIQKAKIARVDLIQVTGSMGDNQEYVYLPPNYTPPEPQILFDSFRSFYDAANS